MKQYKEITNTFKKQVRLKMARSGWIDYENSAYCVGCELKQTIVRRFCERCGKFVRHTRRRLSSRADHVRY